MSRFLLIAFSIALMQISFAGQSFGGDHESANLFSVEVGVDVETGQPLKFSTYHCADVLTMRIDQESRKLLKDTFAVAKTQFSPIENANTRIKNTDQRRAEAKITVFLDLLRHSDPKERPNHPAIPYLRVHYKPFNGIASSMSERIQLADNIIVPEGNVDYDMRRAFLWVLSEPKRQNYFGYNTKLEAARRDTCWQQADKLMTNPTHILAPLLEEVRIMVFSTVEMAQLAGTRVGRARFAQNTQPNAISTMRQTAYALLAHMCRNPQTANRPECSELPDHIRAATVIRAEDLP